MAHGDLHGALVLDLGEELLAENPAGTEDAVLDGEAPLLAKLHDADGRDELRSRSDAEQIARLDGDLPFGIGPPESLAIDQPLAAHDRERGAPKVVAGHPVADRTLHAGRGRQVGEGIADRIVQAVADLGPLLDRGERLARAAAAHGERQAGDEQGQDDEEFIAFHGLFQEVWRDKIRQTTSFRQIKKAEPAIFRGETPHPEKPPFSRSTPPNPDAAHLPDYPTRPSRPTKAVRSSKAGLSAEANHPANRPPSPTPVRTKPGRTKPNEKKRDLRKGSIALRFLPARRGRRDKTTSLRTSSSPPCGTASCSRNPSCR